MPSEISVSDIRNVHIYNRSSRELGLCRTHRDKLCDSIAEKLDELVASHLFQTKFKDFIPSAGSSETVNVRIRITGHRITVQELDQRGRTIGDVERLDLDNIGDEETDEVERINKGILKKANAIYRNHLHENDGHRRRDRSASPLRGRTHHHERRRERDHDRSVSLPIHESRRRHRSESPQQIQTPEALESELGLDTIPQKNNPAEQPVQTHLITTPPHHEQLEELQTRRAELEHQLAAVSAENETLKARLPEAKTSILPQEHDSLIHLSQALSSEQLSGSQYYSGDLKAQFMAMPENIRHAIYYQTYLLVDPLEAQDPWPIGQRLFEGNTISDSASNLCRAHAVRHFLMHTLACDFAQIEGKKPPEELLRRFSQLPEEDQNAVLTQLAFIQPKGDDYRGPAHAFAGQDHLSVTNQERSIAINRVTLDRIAEYHRHHYREQMQQMQLLFQRFQEEDLAVRRELEELQRNKPAS
jgi:hypothetical protein